MVLVVTQSVLDIILVAPVTALAVAEETQTGHFPQTVWMRLDSVCRQ